MKSFATIKNVVFATLLRIETSANLFTELCYGAILSLMINVGRMIIMAKKVVVISTSLRANSNSDKLAQEFAEGAKQAGHEVEYISLVYV